MNQDAIAFQGETQLLRWAETSQGGATITLALSDPADLEKFKLMTLKKKGIAGQRLMTAMVEIGEDEQPVIQSSAPSEKPGQLCIMACTFCEDPDFQLWVRRFHCVCKDKEDAKQFILKICAVDSRKKLDQFSSASRDFHKLVREPFLTWKASQ